MQPWTTVDPRAFQMKDNLSEKKRKYKQEMGHLSLKVLCKRTGKTPQNSIS